MPETRKASKILGGKSLGKPRSRQENNVKADFRDIGSENGM
jgi:hypothetical protein